MTLLIFILKLAKCKKFIQILDLKSMAKYLQRLIQYENNFDDVSGPSHYFAKVLSSERKSSNIN